jgi:hypothetical protein
MNKMLYQDEKADGVKKFSAQEKRCRYALIDTDGLNNLRLSCAWFFANGGGRTADIYNSRHSTPGARYENETPNWNELHTNSRNRSWF